MSTFGSWLESTDFSAKGAKIVIEGAYSNFRAFSNAAGNELGIVELASVWRISDTHSLILAWWDAVPAKRTNFFFERRGHEKQNIVVQTWMIYSLSLLKMTWYSEDKFSKFPRWEAKQLNRKSRGKQQSYWLGSRGRWQQIEGYDYLPLKWCRKPTCLTIQLFCRKLYSAPRNSRRLQSTCRPGKSWSCTWMGWTLLYLKLRSNISADSYWIERQNLVGTQCQVRLCLGWSCWQQLKRRWT